MEKRHVPAFLDELLARLGGWYPLVIQLCAQLLSSVAATIGILYIFLNVDFDSDQQKQLRGAVFVFVLFANLVMLIVMYAASDAVQKRLNSWVKGKATTENIELEARAWRQITAYPWHFGWIAALTAMVGVILPVTAYMYYIVGINGAQAIHIMTGGLISAILLILACILIIEYCLTSARLALLPRDAEVQRNTISGAYLQTRMQTIIAAIILLAALILGQRGYQIAADALAGVKIDTVVLQLQFFLIGLAVMAIGVIFAALLTRTVYQPIHHLVETMAEVEKGNIKKRADIISTDEIALASIQFNTMVERMESLQRHMEDEIIKRTVSVDRKNSQLEAAAQIVRQAAATTSVSSFLDHVAELISEKLSVYHAAIYICDEQGESLIMQTASSQNGQAMLARGEQIRIGGQGCIGQCAAKEKAQLALDAGEDAVDFNNQGLPETRTQLSLPLIVGDSLMGVLDIQSKEPLAFSKEDLPTLQILADQTALAINNTRLLQQSRMVIDELEKTTGESSHFAWQKQLKYQRLLYQYTPFGVQSIDKTATQDMEAGRAGKQMDVSIELRGQKIGTILLQRFGNDARWTDREQNLAAEVASQVAKAVETARLIEDQQKLVQRERQINLMANQVRKSPRTEDILQNTVQELGKALGTSRAFIQIGLPENANTPETPQPKENPTRLAGRRKTHKDDGREQEQPK